jgi:hypothetical protein
VRKEEVQMSNTKLSLIILVLVWILVALELAGCDDWDKPIPGPHEINSTITPSQAAHKSEVVKTYWDGHYYLIFKYKRGDHAAQDGMIGVVHDPDCKCKKLAEPID